MIVFMVRKQVTHWNKCENTKLKGTNEFFSDFAKWTLPGARFLRPNGKTEDNNIATLTPQMNHKTHPYG